MERVEYERMHAVEDRMWWYRGLRALVAESLGHALERSAARGPVLDAGCGTGGMLAWLGSSVAGRPAIGLDYDPLAAILAATKAAVPVMVGTVHEMPLRDGTLSGYVSLDVLCHGAVDPGRALCEARRCLAPGAVAVFNLPAYGWLLSAHDRRVHNVRRFTRGQAHALLARHGFHVLTSTYWNTILFPLMLLHRLMEKKDAPSDVRDYPGWIDALFTAALRLERAVVRCHVFLPFGGSLMVVAQRNE